MKLFGNLEGLAFWNFGDIHAFGPLCHVARTFVALRSVENRGLLRKPLWNIREIIISLLELNYVSRKIQLL